MGGAAVNAIIATGAAAGGATVLATAAAAGQSRTLNVVGPLSNLLRPLLPWA